MSEIADRQSVLEEWQPAENFRTNVHFYLADCSNADYFGNRFKWLREAYVASQFSLLSNSENVRLVPRECRWPDFEVDLRDGRRLSIESTEALLPGKKRGDHCISKSRHRDLPISIDQRREVLPDQVAAVVRKKCERNYPTGTSLLVYVDIPMHGQWTDEIETALFENTAGAREKFHTVWAIWTGRLYRCWPDPVALSTASCMT